MNTRLGARVAVAVMALAVLGLGSAAFWSAVTMQDQATALARAGQQTGGQLQALQALSALRIQLDIMGDEGPAAERMAAVQRARQALPAALERMERGDNAKATEIARLARPVAAQLDPDVERYLTDPKGDILYPMLTVQRLTRQLGRAPTEAEIDANDDGDDDTSRDAVISELAELETLLNGADVNASRTLTAVLADVTRTERRIRIIASVLVPLGVLSVVASAWLLTVLRRRGAEHEHAEHERMRTVLADLPSPVIVADGAGRVELVNEAASDLAGWPAGERHGLEMLRVRDAADRPVDVPALVASARDSGTRLDAGEGRLTRTDGTVRLVTMEAVPLSGSDGGVVFAMLDVTAQRTYEQELHHRAYHDGLTGLPNRAQLWLRIAESMEAGDPYVLLLVDLDGFKAVNDERGHHIGDELLQAVGVRLRAAGREGATVSRLGGDEFAILLRDAGRDQAEEVAAAVRACFADPFPLSCGPVPCGGSVGYAVAAPGESGDTVLQRADQQMYRSKPRGRAVPR